MANEQNQLEVKARESFDALRNCIGKKVIHTGWSYGRLSTDEDKVRKVSDFILMEWGDPKSPYMGAISPFIGCKCGIYKIATLEGETLYENPFLEKDSHLLETEEDRHKLKTMIFGNNYRELVKEQEKKEYRQAEIKRRRRAQERLRSVYDLV